MRILFASAHPFLPEIAGGTQSNTHEMIMALNALGHRAAVVSGLIGVGYLGLRNRVLMKATSRASCSDKSQGYPVYRSWNAWDAITQAVAEFQPDVAIAQSGQILRVAAALRKSGIPTVIYNHNVELDDLGDDIDNFKSHLFVANSNYTANIYREAFGVDSEVIVPLFDRSRYEVTTDRLDVLFVNPHPHKGVDIAIELARRCPDIPFRFVESWTLSKAQLDAVLAAQRALPNLRFFRRTKNVARHYAQAKLLLMPSLWAETWGRVATEAQFSGIPVLATRIGGIPEAVGPGGLLIDPDSEIDAWHDSLRSIWDDETLYATLSSAACVYARRDEIEPASQLQQLERVLYGAIAGATPARLESSKG